MTIILHLLIFSADSQTGTGGLGKLRSRFALLAATSHPSRAGFGRLPSCIAPLPQAFWELFPTIDHVVPVSRGGLDRDDNWVSTSMLLNAAKANLTLEELGWTLHQPVNRWDGLTGWFLRQTDLMLPELRSNIYLRRWRVAAEAVYR